MVLGVESADLLHAENYAAISTAAEFPPFETQRCSVFPLDLNDGRRVLARKRRQCGCCTIRCIDVCLCEESSPLIRQLRRARHFMPFEDFA